MSEKPEPGQKEPEPKTRCAAMLALFVDEARRKQVAYQARRQAWYAALEAVAAMKPEDGQAGPQP